MTRHGHAGRKRRSTEYETLAKRPCKLGGSLNGRTEKHGDEEVPACDISIENLLLDSDEINELLDDKYADRWLFNTKNKLKEPNTRKCGPIPFLGKFEESSVTLQLGLSEDVIELEDVVLAKLRIAPQVGGLTALSLQVQCKPNADDVGRIMAFMGHEIDATVEIGNLAVSKDAKQRDLPLGDEADEETAPAVGGIAEKAASVAKANPRKRRNGRAYQEH